MTREIALHCMKSYSELHSDLCELCPIYGQTGSDHCFEDALQYVIGMLEQEPVLDKIREQIMSNLKGVDIALEVLAENHPLRQKMEGAKDTLVDCLELIDKTETEVEDGKCK